MQKDKKEGKTREMLIAAIRLVIETNTRIYIFMSSLYQVDYAVRFVKTLCADHKIRYTEVDRNRQLKIGNGMLLFRTPYNCEINWEEMRIRGESRKTPIFVDHYLAELQLAERMYDDLQRDAEQADQAQPARQGQVGNQVPFYRE